MITPELLIELYNKGLVSHKPIIQLEINNKVEQLLKIGLTKTKAVSKIALDLGVCERTIYRACKSVTSYCQ